MQVSRKTIVVSLSVLLCLAIGTVVNAQRDPVKADKNPPAPVPAVAVPADKSVEDPDEVPQIPKPIDAKQRAKSISIRGTVFKDDGDPARWSEVWLTGMTHLPGGRYSAAQVESVRADKNGNFEFWHPCWRKYNPEPDEYAILWVLARTRDGTLTSSATLNLTNEYRDRKEIHGLELKTVPKANYSGRIVDGNGKPLPNVKVTPKLLVLGALVPPPANKSMSTLTLFLELAERFTATSDSEGKFTLFGLPESKQVLAKVAAPLLADREFYWGTKTPPELRLEQGGTIRGKITNLPAKELGEQLELLLRNASGGRNDQVEPTVMFTTLFRPQPDGRFEITGVPPGQYQLMISQLRSDFSIPSECYAPVPCEAQSNEVTDNVQLVFPDVITARGRVVDSASGAGIAGVSVFFLKQEPQFRNHIGRSVTDVRGEYRAFLRPGKIVVEAGSAPDGYLAPMEDQHSPAIEYAKDFEGPTFQYERAIVFRGTVVDRQEQPVADADIRWFQPGRKGAGLPEEVVSDEMGQFLLRQIDPEDALPIRVRSSQGVSTALLIPSTELTQTVKIVVSPENAFRMKGTLVDQRGKPVMNASVAVHWHRRYVSKKTRMAGGSGEIEKHKTDEHGRFESSALWSDDGYHVAIEANGFSKKDLPQVKGKIGEVHDYGLVRLTGTSQTIIGRVVDADGKPLANATVFNSGDAPQVVTTASDEAGRFRLAGLLTGPVHIFASHSKYRFAGTYATDSSNEVVLTMSPRSALASKPQAIDIDALDVIRQKSADELAQWVAAANLPYKPVLRDNNFHRLARSDPDEALVQIGKQSVAMDYRSAILISRSLTPFLPRTEATDETSTKEVERALKFVERAASRIDEQDPGRRIYTRADVGLMFLRLGKADRGKTLVEAAAKEWTESAAPVEHLAVNIAQALAWYDVPRALSYRDKVKQDYIKSQILNQVIVEVCSFDIPRALELFKDPKVKASRDIDDDQLRFELAWRIGRVQPQLAADLVSNIVDTRAKAEASGWAAVAVAKANSELARSLIDQGLETLQNDRAPLSKSFYYEWVPGVAANLIVQAKQIGHPELESLIQQALALRIPADLHTTTVSRLQSSVNLALYLAFVDPTISRRLLVDLERELDDQSLGNGGSESVGRQQWLFAWVLADPSHAAKLLQIEMEKPLKDGKRPYWIDAAYTLISLPCAEQLDYVRQYSNVDVSKPYMN